MVRVIDIAGHEDHCMLCPTYRRMTEGGHARTYSLDRGKTWGEIGAPCPPCTGRCP
jgi:hypothetical protein